MDEYRMMQNAGAYAPQEKMNPDQREIMKSLFGRYYKEAGDGMLYLKTSKGQRILGMTLVLIILMLAADKKSKR